MNLSESKPVEILLVEDSPSDAALTIEALEAGKVQLHAVCHGAKGGGKGGIRLLASRLVQGDERPLGPRGRLSAERERCPDGNNEDTGQTAHRWRSCFHGLLPWDGLVAEMVTPAAARCQCNSRARVA